MFGWLVLAAFLALALASYTKVDPGWSHVGSVKDIANSAGRIGAWSADLLLTLFGFLAWMVPVILVVKAIKVFRCRHEPNEWNAWLLLIRSVGVILTIASGAALASLHYHALSELFPSSSGGIIGELLIQQFLPAFNVTGSTLLLMALFLLGMTFYTDLSWFRLMDSVGYWSLRLAVYCKEQLIALYFVLKKKLEARKQKQPEKSNVPPVNKQEPALKPQETHAPPASLLVAEKTVDRPEAPVIIPPPAREKPFPQVENTLRGSLPTASLLDDARHSGKAMSQESLDEMSRLLELKLKDFNVDVEVVAVHPGPVITRFEIQPAPGTKASKITNLASDLARSLAVVSVRVVEVIPGKSVMGIEIPNDDRQTVFFSEIISSRAFDEAQSSISLALGHDISGQPVIVDLAKMPHLLVAGTTGSGKSVGINAMILSMLFKSSPEDVRLIMIDPKMLELSIYDGIPHLLAPVVTDMKEAANALRWCVAEMERRYRLMAHMGVRNIAGYNRKVRDAMEKGEPLYDPFYQPVSSEPFISEDKPPELETLPFIVVVVDEFADMMMIVGKKVEELIARIAQKARAAGIHLILATQRPSVDVITGLIKANVPTRISFQVSSKIDSRTIIDQGGAEQLLGHGDMLYLPPGTSVPVRIHGAFVADDEVHRVVADWQQRGAPDFVEEILNGISESSEGSAFSGGLDNSEQDPLYDEAVAFVTESRRASISSVQRQLKVGYNRAARMIEAMEAAGVVSPALSNGNRDVIAPPPPRH
ncbi:DNA translocase FtsK 4TM domain-containing protein [Endozoicomonas sp. SCSIO W0465]|nr:DNA translocase FtsK 4TM domain-containing protein [Endozoicomonas sp. SCSIO W0465]